MSCSFSTSIAFLLGLAAVPLLATPLPSTPVSTTAGALPADMDIWKSALYNAYSTYCPADQLQDWNCKWCAKLPNVTMVGVVDNELYGTRSYVALQDRTILVAFKGTSNIQNWFEDAEFVWTDLSWDGVPKGVEVETGFLSSYESLRTQVVNYTTQALSRCPGCEIHVTGHSLGGAQAFLFAADMKLLHNLTTRVTTFGCPRVGNSDWGSWFASSVMPHEGSIRMVHNRDCIPMAPPAATGYLHLPHEVWQTTENGTYNQHCKDLPTTGGIPAEDPECSAQYGFTSCVLDDHTSYLGIMENVFNPCSGSKGPCIADGQCSDAGWGADCCSGRTSTSVGCLKNGVCGCRPKDSWAIKQGDCCSRKCSTSIGCKCA